MREDKININILEVQEMTKEKRNYRGKTLRTSSYKKQNAYDRLLANSKISSLIFLSDKYDKDLNRYKKDHDLEIKENWVEYKRMQERKKMIDEELTIRIMNMNASTTSRYQPEFDSIKNVVYKNGETNTKYSTKNVAFDEDENEYIICSDDGYITEVVPLNIVDDDNNIEYNKRDRKDIYKDWEY